MVTIYKYPINLSLTGLAFQSFRGAEIISCGLDGEKEPCIWAKVDTSQPSENLVVYCVGTGWDIEQLLINKNLKFIGTVTDGSMVIHIFQEVTWKSLE